MMLNEKQTAERLYCSVAALRKWRINDKGPAFCKIGRLVRYSEVDLAAYVNANRFEPANAEVAR